ncbi:hypothetical protein B0H11DRAFT_1924952 [Mycena galericulata]|nr:hypothetical protein B0H11DRAFT_1924952 [Mycena galericulata]
MHEVLPSATYGYEVIPDKLWNAGREISRLFFGGNRWVLPFFPAQNPSPISRLSRDILSEIFMWSLCADGFRPVVHSPGNLSLEPLTLSHVSNHWRDVAISTPSLWSTIWIDRPREAHIPMVDLTDKFMKFLTLGNVEDDTPRMLPNLQTISLHDLNGDRIDERKNATTLQGGVKQAHRDV